MPQSTVSAVPYDRRSVDFALFGEVPERRMGRPAKALTTPRSGVQPTLSVRDVPGLRVGTFLIWTFLADNCAFIAVAVGASKRLFSDSMMTVQRC